MHFVECAEPGSVQAEVLREQDLLRGLDEKQRADIAAAVQKHSRQSIARDRVCLDSSDRFDCDRGGFADRAGERSSAGAFAASSRGDLYSVDLIQRA
jgi:hypothetical protein